MEYAIGVDMGSTSTKTAVLGQDGEIVLLFAWPTGWSSVDTARRVRERLCQEGYDPAEYPCVATGYGRVAVPFSHKTITEITCHARGAMRLHRRDTLTVIDIGGQDTKIIRVVDGGVREFVMNDKCSAGTGRFLEVMATTLGMDPEQLCCLAEDGGGVSISSLCTVFAESEVITLVGRGEPRENIAFAVVDSIVKKVASQAGRLEAEGGVCLTGGLCGSAPFRAALGRALRTPVIASPEGRYAGAIGAASYGLELSAKGGAL